MSKKRTESEKQYRDNNFTVFLKKCIFALIDILLITFANYSVCYLTMNGHLTNCEYSPIAFSYIHFIILALSTVIINYLFGLYRSVWQFAGNDEIVRSAVSSAIITLILFGTDRILYNVIFKVTGRLPFYSYLLFYVLTLATTLAPRLGLRIIRRFSFACLKPNQKPSRVMIVGAGFMGNFVIDALTVDDYKFGKPVIAVDDNPAKHHKKLNGVKIVGTCEEIQPLAEKYNIDQIILCIPSASSARQKEVLELAMKTNATVKISPSVEDMLEEGGKRKIRKVEISDLLSRPEVKLDKKVCRYLIDKTILVTGGGGSIGSEICNQVARYSPKTIVIFDIYENCAFELANDLNSKYDGEINIQVRIGSVRDIDRLREVFNEFHPDVVFHAAAHKHVPLMEDSPCEAVKNNVFGTYNVAVVADEFKVPKMVILSTDKAVNPTNVMGCTKRITEIIVQYMNKVSKNTRYAAVRFGNVLGSHGSVIPIFKKQIEEGGPVKVTHPDITRYFMTIPEAAQLVCQAGGLAEGGEIFVLDMGEPVKIMDLAKNLIRLSGFTVEEIGIEIMGLRPGEKLYEELALESELATREKTANEKIYVTHPVQIDYDRFEILLNSLKDINDDNVRARLVDLVPNYHPANNQ
jgi:FlaA1/EpsC-like NDP-sugar epimerase